MKRDLTPEDRDRIAQVILGGDRVEAINIYLSITEGGLTDAQAFIHALTFELDPKPEEPARKQPKKPRFGSLKAAINADPRQAGRLLGTRETK